jgi:MFS family permease
LQSIIGSRVRVSLAEAGVMTASTTLIADCFGGARRQRWLAGQTAVATVAAVVLNQLIKKVSVFFSEEKNQKTFNSPPRPRSRPWPGS